MYGLNSQGAYLRVTASDTQITYNGNPVVNKISYLIIEWIDKVCPPDYIYQYKNDTNCYKCPAHRIMANTNDLFT